MKLIVDANIVFSGILNSQEKIGDLLINLRKHLKFIAPNFLREEIFNHYPKICRICGLALEAVREAEFHVCQDIIYISEEQIKHAAWLTAE